MQRLPILLLALSTLAATATAQNMQSQPAPIERAAPATGYGPSGQINPRINRTSVSRPAQGVVVRTAQNASVRTVSADANRTELTVERGIANVSVRQPARDSQILVNLPGGQTALLKDGLYTFNADTNTVRVLKGEAQSFVGEDTKGVKVKEDHQLAFGSAPIRSVEVDPLQARADLLPGDRVSNPEPRYGEGFYGYPYYSYGYPYGFWGYPYGYGYPFGFGFGFGFRGGFHGRR